MPKKLKRFDAVGESRKWRQQSSALLATMPAKKRIEFINRRIAQFPIKQKEAAAMKS